MDKLFTPQQARVLTQKGFFKTFKENLPGNTREKAYEATERLHQQIDENGERYYSDFDNFNRVAKRFEKKAKAS